MYRGKRIKVPTNKLKKFISSKPKALIKLRSRAEFYLLLYFEATEFIKRFSYEEYKIPFFDGNKKRYYIPDFWTKNGDGSETIWEVKPIKFCGIYKSYRYSIRDKMEVLKNKKKWGGIKGCLKENLGFRVVFPTNSKKIVEIII